MKLLLLLLVVMMGAASSNDIPPGTPIAQCKEQSLECPDFKMVAVKTGYEVRKYPALKWVCTRYAGHEPSSNKMFMKLFNYIQGSNDQGVKIPMTAPVTTYIEPGAGPNCNNNFTMCFFVPTAFWGNTPQPTDKEVFLLDTPESTQYVKAFSGFTSNEQNVNKSHELMTALGNTTVDETKWLTNGYDSPFKLRDRRNEVAFMAK